MSSLLASIASSEKAARKKAQQRYAELLEHNNPTDHDEVFALMKELGKSATDVQTDLDIISRARGHAKIISELKGSDKHRMDADAALAAHKRETERIIEQRKAEEESLWAEAGQAQSDQARAHGNEERLMQLRQERPDLLGWQPSITAS